MVIGRFSVAVRCVGLVESVAVMTAVKEPAAVGVPVMEPPALMESPAGRPVAVKVYGAVPPVALTWVAG